MYKDLDKTHTCIICNKQSHVKHWKCECNMYWHNCEKHRYHTVPYVAVITSEQMQAQNRRLKTGTRRRKRANPQNAGAQTLQEMLEEDYIEEARKKRLIDNGNTEVSLGYYVHESVKPSFLGTEMKRRFGRSSLVRRCVQNSQA